MGFLFFLVRTKRDAISMIFSLGMFLVFSGGMTSTAPRSKCCCHCLVSASRNVSCSSVSKNFVLSSLPLRDLKLDLTVCFSQHQNVNLLDVGEGNRFFGSPLTEGSWRSSHRDVVISSAITEDADLLLGEGRLKLSIGTKH